VQCNGTNNDGSDISTTLGSHAFTVSAKDAAGRQFQVTNTYSVVSCSFVTDPSQNNNDRDFIDLPPARAFDDLTAANSDLVNDVCDGDDDNDGLTDDEETAGPPCPSANGPTNPLRADTDGDLALDGAECSLGFDPASIASKPAVAQCDAIGDSDGDKVSDRIEFCYYNTDPHSTNTDGDGCSDGREIGSVNANKAVDIIDLYTIASAGGASTSPKYVVDFDLTKNGSIDVVDLALAASVYGSCP
jgi:hypothetical protein